MDPFWAHGPRPWPRPMGQGPWAKAHGSRPMGQGPWAEAHGGLPKVFASGARAQPAKKIQKNRFFGEKGSKFGTFFSSVEIFFELVYSWSQNGHSHMDLSGNKSYKKL